MLSTITTVKLFARSTHLVPDLMHDYCAAGCYTSTRPGTAELFLDIPADITPAILRDIDTDPRLWDWVEIG